MGKYKLGHTQECKNLTLYKIAFKKEKLHTLQLKNAGMKSHKAKGPV